MILLIILSQKVKTISKIEPSVSYGPLSADVYLSCKYFCAGEGHYAVFFPLLPWKSWAPNIFLIFRCMDFFSHFLYPEHGLFVPDGFWIVWYTLIFCVDLPTLKTWNPSTKYAMWNIQLHTEICVMHNFWCNESIFFPPDSIALTTCQDIK